MTERERAIPPGSIPACAGEPDRHRQRAGTSRVYPRVCGGTQPVLSCEYATMGLSPRVRGNPNSWPLDMMWSGSIPACAGEPQTSQSG